MTILNKYITFSTSLIFTCCLAAHVLPAHAYVEADFQQAVKTFKLPNEKDNFERAANAFKAMLAKEPTHPVLMAYSGSATSRLALTTLLPWKKMSYAEEGLAQIDKALHLAKTASPQSPNVAHDEIVVKFVALNTFLAVPEFMNRKARGEQLLKELLKPETLALAASGLKGEILLYASEWAEKNQQPDLAKQYLQQVIDAKAPQAEQAKALLKGKSA